MPEIKHQSSAGEPRADVGGASDFVRCFATSFAKAPAVEKACTFKKAARHKTTDGLTGVWIAQDEASISRLF